MRSDIRWSNQTQNNILKVLIFFGDTRWLRCDSVEKLFPPIDAENAEFHREVLNCYSDKTIFS